MKQAYHRTPCQSQELASARNRPPLKQAGHPHTGAQYGRRASGLLRRATKEPEETSWHPGTTWARRRGSWFSATVTWACFPPDADSAIALGENLRQHEGFLALIGRNR